MVSLYASITVNDVSLAKKYIKWGQEFLTQEYGSYEGRTTGMDVDEDTNDEWYRDSLKK